MAKPGTIKKQRRWCPMKNDYEVKLSMSERRKGMTQKQAAARAGMSERTARKYEQAGPLPPALKRPHQWETPAHPFQETSPLVGGLVQGDPAPQLATFVALLRERHAARHLPPPG